MGMVGVPRMLLDDPEDLGERTREKDPRGQFLPSPFHKLAPRYGGPVIGPNEE